MLFFSLSPLEQFNYFSANFILGGFTITLTEQGYSLAFIMTLIFIIVNFHTNLPLVGEEPIQSLLSAAFNSFVTHLILTFKENLSVKYMVFYPWFLFLYLQILLANVLGMLPYFQTITSIFTMTILSSLAYFSSVNLVGLCINFSNILRLFLPKGTPLLLAPLLVIIELVSYFARVLSLAVRLFANIMSGHTLLHILGGVV